MNGAIVLWLCQGATRAPDAVKLLTPECPVAPGGIVSGTLTADNVVAQMGGSNGAAQQIQQSELDEVIAAIKAGRAYVNVHSSVSPGGEIRGQIESNPAIRTASEGEYRRVVWLARIAHIIARE